MPFQSLYCHTPHRYGVRFIPTACTACTCCLRSLSGLVRMDPQHKRLEGVSCPTPLLLPSVLDVVVGSCAAAQRCAASCGQARRHAHACIACSMLLTNCGQRKGLRMHTGTATLQRPWLHLKRMHSMLAAQIYGKPLHGSCSHSFSLNAFTSSGGMLRAPDARHWSHGPEGSVSLHDDGRCP